jgi:hypothetical protein
VGATIVQAAWRGYNNGDHRAMTAWNASSSLSLPFNRRGERKSPKKNVSGSPQFQKWKELRRDWFLDHISSSDEEHLLSESCTAKKKKEKLASLSDNNKYEKDDLNLSSSSLPSLLSESSAAKKKDIPTTTPLSSLVQRKLQLEQLQRQRSSGIYSSSSSCLPVDSTRELQWQEMQRGWSTVSKSAHDSSNEDDDDGNVDEENANGGKLSHNNNNTKTDDIINSHDHDDPMEATTVALLVRI